MSPRAETERSNLIAVMRRAESAGINRGTSGNASFVSGSGLVITPSAKGYDDMVIDDLVFIDRDGHVRGDHRPSSEWPFHRRIYQERSDIRAIVHLHSPAATALSTLRLGIPPFHYMVAVAGGSDVRCSEYATFGTDELANYAVEAMEGRHACLLANHGLVAGGSDVRGAYALAVEVESLAQQYLLARQVGEPVLLAETDMAEVLEKFADYRRD